MTNIPCRIVDQVSAEYLQAETQGREQEIIPRLIDAGPYAGQYAFSENVMTNPSLSDLWDYIISVCPTVIMLNVEDAWPTSQ